ncbi:MAG: nucleotidyltransferase domain-containing protein [Planctomycetes bacterium]|nr:nucleotidyltransferase domain-containing protein [Planctomycetota bacterium]
MPALAVHENPFAAVPLPDGVLNGPYDARYRIDLTPRNGRYTGRIQRAFAGEELIAANQLLHANSGIYERIDRFARQITQQFHPERVILFGSHARGTAEPDSDVDLLVIFPGNRDLSEKALEIRRRINPEFPLDLLTRSAGQVARRCRLGDPFFTEILASGRLIYP